MAPVMKALALAIFLVAPISVMGAPLQRRQLAGVGGGCDSIFTSIDNGVGYSIEDALDNTAATIGTLPKSPAPAVGGPVKRSQLERRQLNKIVDGVNAFLTALGQPAIGGFVDTVGNTIDTYGTNDAADAGAQAGTVLDQTLEGLGQLAP